MGKHIDRWVLMLLIISGLYLFFLNAWKSIPLAMVLAFFGGVILKKALAQRPIAPRCSRFQADQILNVLTQMDDAAAQSILEPLIRRRYAGEDFALRLLMRHSSQRLSPGDVLAQWKKHRHIPRLVIAFTGSADPQAVAYAREMTDPQIAILERRHLCHLIRRMPPKISIPAAHPTGEGLRRLLRKILDRPWNMKSVGFNILLIALYGLAGNPIYLILGLTNLFLFGCTLPNRRFKGRLF